MSSVQPTQANELLTAQEVADRFRVSVSTVTRWAREGSLPTVRFPGARTVRFRASDVEAFLAGEEAS